MNTQTKKGGIVAIPIAGELQSCFLYHRKPAQNLGGDTDETHKAIELARDIRASGDKHMDEVAERWKKSGEEPHA